MMKLTLTAFLLILMQQVCFGQNLSQMDTKIDSLQNQLLNPSSNTAKIKTIFELSSVLIGKGWTTTNLGQFAIAYESFRQTFELLEKPEFEKILSKEKDQELKKANAYYLANATFNYGHLMGVTGNIAEQLLNYQKTYKIARASGDIINTVYALTGIAFVHLKNNNLDSARIWMDKVKQYPLKFYINGSYSDILYVDGSIKLKSGQFEEAKNTFLTGAHHAMTRSYVTGQTTNYLGLSKVYRHLNVSDSSKYYAIETLRLLKKFNEIQLFEVDIPKAYENLYQHFLHFNQPDSAFHYLKLAHQERDILTAQKVANLAAFQQVLLKREQKLSVLEKEKIQTQSKIRFYFFGVGLIVLSVIGFILYRNNRQKQKANLLLNEQKEKVEQSLKTLQSTQAQLIQKEKLASLGELTAGIAHEIQNPLNFVNNFSELSVELAKELKVERLKVKEERDEELENELVDDLIQNQEKINLHGKRASSIVKGMLEHSRTSTGVKEPTDINALADEYLRFAYHGIRAKDKTDSAHRFNSEFELITDENLPKIEVISQDMGRVLLNLINNAFWAVNEKSKKGEAGYEPKVTVSTQLIANSQLLIAIKDNGIGMTEEVKAKIFQPFFTTKPTGQGTGLGLSLAYDIVTKGHGGTLEVASSEGVNSEFTITLPIQNTKP